MEELNCFRYQGVDLCSVGGMEAEWEHRIGEDRKIAGALKNVWKKKITTEEKWVCIME